MVHSCCLFLSPFLCRVISFKVNTNILKICTYTTTSTQSSQGVTTSLHYISITSSLLLVTLTSPYTIHHFATLIDGSPLNTEISQDHLCLPLNSCLLLARLALTDVDIVIDICSWISVLLRNIISTGRHMCIDRLVPEFSL